LRWELLKAVLGQEKFAEHRKMNRFLIFSDLHHLTESELEKSESYKEIADFIIFLGDISPEYAKQISLVFSDKTIFFVYGNHDERGQFAENLHFSNFHTDLITHENCKFTGFEGSHRYKPSGVMYSQKESILCNKKLSSADVLFTHDTAYNSKISVKKDVAHCGLKGIEKYLKKYKPKYHFHGHLHLNMCYKFRKTTCVSVFRAIFFDYDTGEIINIF
jgi:Icc-related predicted phosphoesterase